MTFSSRTRSRRAAVLLGAVVALAAATAACKPPAPDGTAAKPKEAYFPGTPEDTFVMDTPDPSVLYDANTSTYHLYSTRTVLPPFFLPRIPHLQSTDLETWEIVGDALPGAPPAWAAYDVGLTWSPSVLSRPLNPPGSEYVMYYVARDLASGSQCIGIATSSTLTGPFVDSSDDPFMCQRQRGGSIDPSYYETPDGKLFFAWSSLDHFNCCDRRSRVWTQKLTPDGLERTGGKKSVLRAKLGGHEQAVIENPAFNMSPDGKLFLYYSMNFWPTANYAIGVAKCHSVKGPCNRTYGTPVLASRANMLGPGSPTFFANPAGKLRVGFHAWSSPYVGYEDQHPSYPDGEGNRSFHTRGVRYTGGLPSIG